MYPLGLVARSHRIALPIRDTCGNLGHISSSTHPKRVASNVAQSAANQHGSRPPLAFAKNVVHDGLGATIGS